jgi:hypothetical protein
MSLLFLVEHGLVATLKSGLERPLTTGFSYYYYQWLPAWAAKVLFFFFETDQALNDLTQS